MTSLSSPSLVLRLSDHLSALTRIVEDILAQLPQNDEINLKPLDAFMQAFEQELKHVRNIDDLGEYLEQFQLTLSRLIQRLQEKRTLLQQQIETMSQRSQGIRVYTANQLLSQKKES